MVTTIIWFVILWILALVVIGLLYWILKGIDMLENKETQNVKTKKTDR